MAIARMRRACLASAIRAASARNCEILRSWRVISIADMLPRSPNQQQDESSHVCGCLGIPQESDSRALGISEQPLAPFATPMAGRHVGRSPGLVDEHKLFRIKAFLHLAPGETGGLNIKPFLFRGVQSFFYRSILDAAKSAQRRTVRT